MNRKLPIGIQDFISIREDGYCYVDKTARIYELISGSGRAFFLSRPRRFGKSLLCSTLGAIFEGRRDLFAGIAGQPALAINSLEWEWKKHPVIRLDLNPGDYNQGVKTLNSTIGGCLRLSSKKTGVPLAGEDIAAQFQNMIYDAAQKAGEKVAVIIDEYDKPLLASIDKPELYEIFRSALKGFTAFSNQAIRICVSCF